MNKRLSQFKERESNMGMTLRYAGIEASGLIPGLTVGLLLVFMTAVQGADETMIPAGRIVVEPTVEAAPKADQSTDVLASLADGDAEAMREIQRQVQPATTAGNRVAQMIVHEARLAQGHVSSFYDNFEVRANRGRELEAEIEEAWLAAVERRANEGDPFFMNVMGMLAWEGRVHPLDRQKSVEWWVRGAEAGGAMAMLRLGACYLDGPMPHDAEKAAMYYREAAERGISTAWQRLGNLYRSDPGPFPQDTQMMLKYWIKAAEMGRLDSQYAVGLLYMSGEGDVSVDKELGEKWLRIAAQRGHRAARSIVTQFLDREPNVRELPEAIPIEGTRVAASFIAFDRIAEHIKEANVSVVGLVDEYHPRPFTGRSRPGSTPSSMLDSYLSELRTLGLEEAEGNESAANPADVQILIIECHASTRAMIQALDKQFGFNAYDGTIPVVYVFTAGQSSPVKAFTFRTGAGSYGATLKQEVVSLLNTRLLDNILKVTLGEAVREP